MREKKNHLYVDSQERSILLHSLVVLKNQLIQQGRYTDCVDELIFKVVILSILVDTFFTRISMPKRQHPEIHSISVV